MPRKGKVKKRDILPDAIFNSKIVSAFINHIMKDGKKNLAQRILYNSFNIIEEKTKKKAIDVFSTAINNAMPDIKLKTRRIGAVNYQIPVEIKQEEKLSLSIRWLVKYARERKGKSMYDKLANEIIDAANNSGSSIKKKNDVHKMALANKAYAHYRW